MAKELETLLARIGRRIEALEAELRKLRNTQEVLRSLDVPEEEPLGQRTPKKLVEAVALALETIGPAGSADVIEWLTGNWDREVNPGSVRSTLSGCKGKLFDNDGKKWWVIEK